MRTPTERDEHAHIRGASRLMVSDMRRIDRAPADMNPPAGEAGGGPIIRTELHPSEARHQEARLGADSCAIGPVTASGKLRAADVRSERFAPGQRFPRLQR